MQILHRRGYTLGAAPTANNHHNDPVSDWNKGQPVLLSGICRSLISDYKTTISATENLVLHILENGECDEFINQPPYSERFTQHHSTNEFISLGAAYNEGDEQEIETLLFDEVSGEDLIAEDLWLKVSWLSFHDEDPSLRFRFSFGVDLAEDVAADPVRQSSAARLAECIFPESAIITNNAELTKTLASLLGNNQPEFVERILYFNAPNGGAYLHHDLERGHAGVVYAQITGATLWLALPQHELIHVVSQFISTHPLPVSLSDEQEKELQVLGAQPERLGQELNSFANDALIHLINETEEFVQYLLSLGHFRILNAGDVILLPQANAQNCCWHSVFCLGDEMGEALSFAIR